MKSQKKKKWKTLSRHVLYEASVQNVEVDYAFFQRVFKRNRNRRAVTLREDFCGTAVLTCEWVRRNQTHKAWGIDLDPKVLQWGRDYRVCELKEEQMQRLALLCEDVTQTKTPPVDIICALNFSYSIFKERAELLQYFKCAYNHLNEEGLFIIDSYGGPATMDVTQDHRSYEKGRDWAGNKYPKFDYYWEQASFNFVNNHTRCHIHFRLPGGVKMKKAFTYDWRLWSTPELRDVLRNAGFRRVDVYIEGWDDQENDTDGIMRKRTCYEHMLAWVSYMVAVK